MNSRHPRAPRPAATAPSRPSLDQRLAKLHRLRLNGLLTAPHGRRLRHEPLEDRRLLALITVTTVDDVVDFNDGRTSLREAVFAANIVPGADEIRFDFGHDGPATISLSQGAIRITESLTIAGPGRDLLTIDATASDPTPDVLDGQGSCIFSIEKPLAAPLENVALTGLTLTGGEFFDGGAIICSANLTLDDVRFADNHATVWGGAIYMKLGRLDATRTEFVDNSAGVQGGAVYALAEVFVADSDFRRNSARFYQGGALFQGGFDFLMHITDSRFTENSASSGGAIDASRGPLTVENSVFTANTASSAGGAIRAVAAANYPNKLVLITSSNFANNSAGQAGGALDTGGKVEIRASEISGNTAAGGGAIHHSSARVSSLLLHNVTIDDNTAVRGGGVYTRAATTIEHSIITNNTAMGPNPFDGRGGGVLHIPSDGRNELTVRWSTIANNLAASLGGGVHGVAVSILNSTITGNTAGDLAARHGQGGGLYLGTAASPSARIDNSTISDNTAGLAGGGIFSRKPLIVNRSVISDNKAGSTGGGLDVTQLTMTASLVTGNAAGAMNDNSGKGGGIWFNAGTKPTIDSSTISDNFAGSAGGGFAGNAAVTVTNSTISGNTARSGGGAQGYQLTFRHSTITDNSAIFIRGDLGEGGGLTGNVILIHTILAGNHAAAGAPDLDGQLNPASRYSIVGDRSGTNIQQEAPIGVPDANGNLIGGPTFGPIDPLLAPLADNGGPTLPGGIVLPTHALLPGSPAFNAGDPNFIPGPAGDSPEFDQRGAPYARKAVLRIDIGAFEQQPPGGLFTADANGDQLTDGHDFLAWQREFNDRPPSLLFADFTANGRVDSNDLAVWTARFGDDEIAMQSPPLPSPERGREQPSTNDPTSSEHRAVVLFASAEEAIESAPSPILVTTLADEVNLTDNQTSLREALFAANITSGHQEITFDPALFTAGPGAILLTQGELAIADSLALTGPGTNLLTIDASGNDPTPDQNNSDGSRVLQISNGDPLTFDLITLQGLKLTGGDAQGGGGAIYSAEDLALVDCMIVNNAAGQGGGVLCFGGSLSVLGGVISGNSALTADGGGVALIGLFNPVGRLHKAAFKGVTISGNTTHFLGGGVSLRGIGADGPPRSSLEISDSTIIGNTAGGGGGGAYINSCPTIISTSHFSENSGGTGGGLFATSSPLTVQDSVFDHNVSSRNGGALAVDRFFTSAVSLSRCIVSNNQAASLGGGLYLNQFALASPNSIANCTITNNTAGLHGGGVYAVATNISSSLIQNNRAGVESSATARGGGVYFVDRSSQIDSSTINGNFASASGGGVYAPATTVDNSTVSGNTARRGGGLAGTHFAVRHSTVTGNSTAFFNGTLGNGGGIAANATLDHAIVAGNHAAGNFPDIAAASGAGPIRYSILGDIRGSILANEAPLGAPDAHGNLIGGPIHGPIDPLLAPLADNGGPTLPGGAGLLTHALLPGSPAIDAGDPALKAGVGDTPLFDQRGEPFSRVVGTRIDIGALEQTGVPLVVDTLIDESDGDYRRGDVSLREAILLANAQSGPEVIQFDPALTAAGPAAILLTHGELAITDSLTLNGPGANLLTIDASGNDPEPNVNNGRGSRVFNISDDSTTVDDVILRGLTLTGGDVATSRAG